MGSKMNLWKVRDLYLKKKRIGEEVKSIKKTFKTQFFLCSYFSYTRLNGKVP